MRTKINLNKDWYFSHIDVEEAKEIQYNDSCWSKVNLPHDWSVGQGFEKQAISGSRGGYTKTGVGYYRKLINVTGDMLSERVFLEFDGVFMNSTVWVNGVEVGMRPYGYISFGYLITPFLHEGINLIAVRVDCEKQTQSRWYNGCGINRQVWLTVTKKLYVEQWGSYIRTELTGNSAVVRYTLDIANTSGASRYVEIETTIKTQQGITVAKSLQKQEVLQTGFQLIDEFRLEHPLLWSTQTPHLYTVETVISEEGDIIDCYATTFGIRSVEFVPQKGFFLNGQPTKIKGVCLHHEGGVVGAAVPTTIWMKRIKLLKEMGCNAIRTAHNPFSPEFYEVCDALGMMVVDEAFDGWDTPKAEYDYGRYFNEWHHKDAVDFIKRDRNHPCVVLWSIGNEVHKMRVEMTRKLLDIFHENDPSRLVTCGVQGVLEGSEANRAVLDIAGYNDGGGACFVYERDHQQDIDRLMIATEAPHTLQTRGFYRTQTWWRDKNQPRIEIPNLSEEEVFLDGNLKYSSSYDNCGVRTCCRDSWKIAERLPYLCGEFRWTGIDYYGESYGWPARKMESGVIDSANFPKDHYYLYQSMWTCPDVEPMVHLLPHWTHPYLALGTEIPICVYTNGEEGELFLNGQSLGKKVMGEERQMVWQVPYEPGELKALAYYKGKVVAEKAYKTAGRPTMLSLQADTVEPVFDGNSTIQVDCCATDIQGVMVPYAENTVHFLIEGLVELVGTENGDALDLTPLTSPKRQLFAGLCAVTMRLSDMPGDIRVVAASLLGERIFAESTEVYIAVESLKIGVKADSEKYKYDIYYTLDATKPDTNSTPYVGKIILSVTTKVNASIYKEGKKIFELSELFVKGIKEPIIDLTHGNKLLNLDKTVGPFSEKLFGCWSDGAFEVKFNPDGTLVRIIDEYNEQKLGDWWYDFPIDFFEAQDYAGTGEIWFYSGEKQIMNLKDQLSQELIIDNTLGGIGTTYGNEKTITLKKKA